MDSPIFQLQDVSYSYLNRFPALRGLSLVIRRGESLAVIGPNASGKSTLMKLLDGLIFPSSGEVMAFGHRISEAIMGDPGFSSYFRKRVGFLFQNPEVQLFCPTVWEEIAFGPIHLGLDKGEIQERTEDLIKILGLEDLRDRPPHTLSEGERKKVALAAILSPNPEVLLLDEPTEGLDPKTQAWLMGLLAELHRAGKTLVLATHDLGIAERASERAFVLAEDHTPLAQGDLAEILANEDLLLQANLIYKV